MALVEFNGLLIHRDIIETINSVRFFGGNTGRMTNHELGKFSDS